MTNRNNDEQAGIRRELQRVQPQPGSNLYTHPDLPGQTFHTRSQAARAAVAGGGDLADGTRIVLRELAAICGDEKAAQSLTLATIARLLGEQAHLANLGARPDDAPAPPSDDLPARVPAALKGSAAEVTIGLVRVIRGHGGPATPDVWLPSLYAAEAVLEAARVRRDAQAEAAAGVAGSMRLATAAELEEAIRLHARFPADWKWRVDIRPRRKHVGLSVERGGLVVVQVPPNETPADLVITLRTHQSWLHTAVEKQSRFTAGPVVKELVNGEGFRWLGRNHKLRIVMPGPQLCCAFCTNTVDVDPAQPVQAIRRHGAGLAGGPGFELWAIRDSLSAESIIGWYMQQGQRWVDEHAPAWAGRMGVRDIDITVRDIGRGRWGVFRPQKARIDLSWTLFQLDRSQVEETLVHELAHTVTIGAGHGREWKRVMDRTLQDWRELEALKGEPEAQVWTGHVAPPAGQVPVPVPVPSSAGVESDAWRSFCGQVH